MMFRAFSCLEIGSDICMSMAHLMEHFDQLLLLL